MVGRCGGDPPRSVAPPRRAHRLIGMDSLEKVLGLTAVVLLANLLYGWDRHVWDIPPSKIQKANVIAFAAARHLDALVRAGILIDSHARPPVPRPLLPAPAR